MFGQFLKSKGVLDDGDIQRILEAQEETHVWFGTLAYLLDFIRFEQIGQVLAAQRQQPGTLFGEMAIELGFMGPHQVDRVLKLQGDKRIRFGEVAVSLDYLTPEQLGAYLAEYLD